MTGSRGTLVTLNFQAVAKGNTTVTIPNLSVRNSQGRSGRHRQSPGDCHRKIESMKRRRNQRGLTLVELIVAFTIMLILTTMAVPLARARVRMERERELRYCLREMRNAIDKYKDYCDAGYFGPPKLGTNCYPETLEILVEGQKLTYAGRQEDEVPAQASPGTRSPAPPSGACAATRTIPSPPVGAAKMYSMCTPKPAKRMPDGTPYSEC